MPAIKHIMAVMPYSPADDSRIVELVNLAQRCRASVSVVSCYEPTNALMSFWRPFKDHDEQRRREADNMLRHIESLLLSAGVDVLSTMVATEPEFEIRKALLEQGADLLVTPAEHVAVVRGHPVGPRLQGMLRESPVPVWRLCAEGTLTPRRVLLVLEEGLLCSEVNQRLINWAVLFARLMETELHVMLSMDSASDEFIHGHYRSRQIDEVMKALEGSKSPQAKILVSALEACPRDIPLQGYLRKGSMASQIRALVKDIDANLVLMSSGLRPRARNASAAISKKLRGCSLLSV